MSDLATREHVADLLRGKGAHVEILPALEEFPARWAGAQVEGAPHTPWQLLEHLRLCLWDILEFSRDAGHVSPEFPDGYWPARDAPESEREWLRSVESIRADLQAMVELVLNPETDLLARIPHGEGQTVLREALLAADHNAYHLGQLVQLQKILSARTADA